MKFSTEKHLSEFINDIFEYKKLSMNLLDSVISKMETPNTFGLYGNWGSGKSTMIHFMLEHIRKSKKKYQSIYPIYFEPWKYEYSDNKDLLFALMSQIRAQCGVKRKIFKKVLVDALAIGAGIYRNVKTSADTVGLGAFPDLNKTVEDISFLEDKLYSESEKWIDKIESYKDEFQKIVDIIIAEKKTKKLIIFIDDLDRCLPENTVKLLEGIKNYLTVKNCVFVLAIDKRIVSEMIGKKYGLYSKYGEEYLMKIIQYYYDLPINSPNILAIEILNSYGLSYEPAQLNYISDFLQEFGPEPRIAKHILHQFCMNVALSKKAQENLAADSDKTTLQYLFVASFLLTRFSKYFSNKNNSDRLGILRRSVGIRKGWISPGGTRDSAEGYANEIKKDTVISDDDRKILESVMEKAINTGREASPEKLLNNERLSSCISIIRTAF